MATQTPSLLTAQSVVKGNLGVPFALLTMLGMMTLPMPAILLDLFFSFNIALSLVVLLVAVYATRPLDFAVFPTILLIATLLRLALNVASTRVVLLHGHQGGDAAGKVIEAFGEVVIGGNYAVGLVVFAILVIINFVVVTKGAGRISEVSARFTLDAMPGKQMAIDADLNAGMLTQEEAQARRTEVSQEADFYGSMDGASKFVRGDAIAGILILVINIVGGLAIGIAQYDLEFADAMQKYSLLTIGDGLVAQIPSLLLSTAAAMMVTRVTSGETMSEQVSDQMFGSPKAVTVAAVVLIVMGSVPGMPHFAFLGLGFSAAAVAWYIYSNNKKQEVVQQREELQVQQDQQQQPALPELGWDDVVPVDIIGLEVGYRLIPMVDNTQGGELLSRIKGIRKKLSQELGFLIPSVHIRDNLDLAPSAYRISMMGVTIGESEIQPDRFMAIDPGQVFGTLEGIETIDPAFGLKAVWIDAGQREHAQTLGYTVVDASTVVATHLNQLLLENSYQLLGHEEVQELLDMLERTSPKLAEELVPNTVSISTLVRVLGNLLTEQVPVRDMRSIAESITEVTPKTDDPERLTAAVRIGLSRMIVQQICKADDDLPVITLDPSLEQILINSANQTRGMEGAGSDPVLEPMMANNLQQSLQESVENQEIKGEPAVLLVSEVVRSFLAKFARYGQVKVHVLSYQEIPQTKKITIVSTIGRQDDA
ncbi:MAG: flagellar biosynthesis protein FlhA [Pseudomonadales bacterium]|nr:flagellar biosynthesis protein FlhA [Pseudomonadales bacterium]